LAESPIPSSPDPIAVDSDEESDNPLAMRAMEDLKHGLLSMAGIEEDGVTLTLDEAVEYVLATSESIESPRPSSPDPIAVDSDEESDDPLAMRMLNGSFHCSYTTMTKATMP
jgi:hypothetical protein